MGTDQRAGPSRAAAARPEPDHPSALAIQKRYVEAGSDVLSHTFGACRIALNRHGEGDRTAEINRAAVAIARGASASGYVLRDIGPFGGLMALRRHRPGRGRLKEQARALVDAGADGIIIETQTAFEEPSRDRRGQGGGGRCGDRLDRVRQDGQGRRAHDDGVSPDGRSSWSRPGCDVAALNRHLHDMEMSAHRARYRAACGLPVMVPNAGQRAREHAGPL